MQSVPGHKPAFPVGPHQKWLALHCGQAALQSRRHPGARVTWGAIIGCELFPRRPVPPLEGSCQYLYCYMGNPQEHFVGPSGLWTGLAEKAVPKSYSQTWCLCNHLRKAVKQVQALGRQSNHRKRMSGLLILFVLQCGKESECSNAYIFLCNSRIILCTLCNGESCFFARLFASLQLGFQAKPKRHVPFHWGKTGRGD